MKHLRISAASSLLCLIVPTAFGWAAPAAPAQTATPARPAAAVPLSARLNFWGPDEQERGYRSMETIFPTHAIQASNRPSPLPVAAHDLKIQFSHKYRPYTVDEFMKVGRVSGLLVVKDGKIMLERYAMGRQSNDRWTSFSIAKSVTSMLVGAAIRDGAIQSVDDPVTRYIPELKGGAYDGVTIAQLLTMTSGVKWTEDYADPASDFSRYTTGTGPKFFKRMSGHAREHPAGTQFHYSTADSNILGAVVMKATGKSLAPYLSEKIWKPFGMEKDAVWMVSDEGMETGGICISATLRDYGRLGLFMLGDGRAGTGDVFPAGWVKQSTTHKVDTTYAGYGYGYQWWVRPGLYQGIGIMGQALVVVPEEKLVVVIQSAWTTAGSPDDYALQASFIDAVRAAARTDTGAD